MRCFRLDLGNVPEDIRAGVGEVAEEYPERFNGTSGTALRFLEDPATDGLSVMKTDGITIRYKTKTDAFRALGRVMGEASDNNEEFSETSRFDTIGTMFDVSRNGVLRPDAFRSILLRYALMGLNMAMLYTEDTYELPGEPFFGYLRGAYTRDELKALDDYAHQFGIEMLPCIQTLAHMAMVLQWPAYRHLQDTEQVLIAEEEETYAFIEKMIKAATAPFRSNRIHLGMDEAQGIGLGWYRRRHGDKPPFEILNDHLARVREICRREGLEPMIWSDMYFRLGSETNDYYDRDIVIPPEVIERIPKDVRLVYWDYYHLDKDFYCEWIDRHRALGSEPIMAGGVWTWNRYWATMPFTFNALDACMGACREKGLREVFMTMWADGGAECDVFSALPGLQYFAEYSYADTVDPDLLRTNFRGSCDADFDGWTRASELDAVPCLKTPDRSTGNVSKWLLLQDPMLALMDPCLEGADLRAHYESLARDLDTASQKGGPAGRLRFPARIADALALKAHLRRDMAAAYKAADHERLRRFVDDDIPTLIERVREVWKVHRDVWMEIYKPFGWECIERRYGGLVFRLQTVAERLAQYLDGKLDAIPELEAKLEPLYELDGTAFPVVHASRVATPSFIK